MDGASIGLSEAASSMSSRPTSAALTIGLSLSGKGRAFSQSRKYFAVSAFIDCHTRELSELSSMNRRCPSCNACKAAFTPSPAETALPLWRGEEKEEDEERAICTQ